MTPEEARQQVEAERQKIQQQEQAQLTRQQLMKQTQQSAVLRKQEARQIESEKQQALIKLQKYEKEKIIPVEKAIVETEKIEELNRIQEVQEKAYKQALEDALEGRAGISYPDPEFDKYYKEFRPKLFAEVGKLTEIKAQNYTFVAGGDFYKPITKDGKVSGFEVDGQSIRIEDLPPAKLEALQRASIIKVTETPSITIPSPQNINPKTGKPYGVVDVAPTEYELWKEKTAGHKYIGGTLQYFGDVARRTYEKSEQYLMHNVEGYQPTRLDATGNLFEIGGRVAPYAIPGVAPILLTGVGVEHLATPGGRAEINLLGTQLEKNYNIPSEVAWALPVAEIAIGTSPYWVPRVKGYLATRGREYIPPQKITDPKVLSGDKTFPTAGSHLDTYSRAKLHKSIFEDNIYSLQSRGYGTGGYHAYPEPWTDPTLVTQPAHIAPSVSGHFLKISKTSTPSSFTDYLYGDVGGTATSPGVMYISTSKFKPVMGVEYPRGVYTWKGSTSPGTAYVPGTKGEIQAVFVSDTQLFPTGGEYYSTWRGVRYPIDTYSTILSSDTTAGATTTLGEVSSSYSGLPSSYQVLPASSSVVSGGASSILSSSYDVSIPSSSVISPTKSSYQVSIPSYKPLVSSYKAPYTSKTPYSTPTSSISKPVPSYSPVVSSYKPKPISTSKYPIPPSYKDPVPPPIKKPKHYPTKKKILFKKRKAYRTFIKRYGRWTAMKGTWAKSEAIRRGVRYTRKTLGASFKVLPTKGLTKGIEDKYVPSKRIFRSYKIRKGRKIPLKDSWIQLAKKRLSRRSEVSEIQSARKGSKRKIKKPKKINWLK